MLKQFDEKVITVVLYIKPRQTKPASEYNVSLGDSIINRFTYPVIQLTDYVEQIRSGQYRELAPLLSVLVANPDESTLQEEQALILGEDDPQKQADLFALAFAIGLRDFDEKVIKRIFRKEINKMKESSLITGWLRETLDEGFEKGMEQGMEQGLEQGLEQGAKKGRVEEAHKNILRILSMRFNQTSSQLALLKNKLQAIRDLTVLDQFVGYAIQDYTINDFSVRLNNTGPAG